MADTVLSVQSAYIDGDGGVLWQVFNSAAISLQLTGKFKETTRGQIVSFNATMTPSVNRLVNTQFLSLGRGYILSARVYITSGTASRGQCWNVVGISNAVAGQFVDQSLISDYVTTTTPVTYPGGSIKQSTEGRGFLARYALSAPAPGVNYLYTAPANILQRFIAFSITLATSVTVVNRLCRIGIIPTGVAPVMIFSDTAPAVPASNAINVAFANYQNTPYNDIANGWIFATVPEVFLTAGGTINDLSDGIQHGAPTDNWGVPYFLFEEWINV